MAEHRVKTPENSPYSTLKRCAAGVAALATTAALSACPKQEPQPLPGERLGLVRITTGPPGLEVRTVSQVTAGPPALVEKFGSPEKISRSPQDVSVSYKPGFGTQMTVHAYLNEAPGKDTSITLSCDVYADGQLVQGAGDSEVIDNIVVQPSFNKSTAFVLCIFNESFAPPLPPAGHR